VNGVAAPAGGLERAAGLDAADTEPESAERLLGFAPRRPGGLGAPSAVRVEPGGEYVLRVDGARVAELAAALGLDTDGIPSETGRVEVAAAAGIAMEFHTSGGDVWVHQMPAPVVRLPADWNVEALGRLYLAALGLGPAEARALAATIDWRTTLVVPVPAGKASAADVSIDGADGIVLESRQDAFADARGPASPLVTAERPRAAAMWQKGGIVYWVAGDLPAEELVAIAADLR
jgi:hypothetical protein